MTPSRQLSRRSRIGATGLLACSLLIAGTGMASAQRVEWQLDPSPPAGNPSDDPDESQATPDEQNPDEQNPDEQNPDEQNPAEQNPDETSALPTTPPPGEPPPAPPAQPPAPPAQPPPAADTNTVAPGEGDHWYYLGGSYAPATGQWVYTQLYGWIWMPYGDQYVNSPAVVSGDCYPYEYVYYPFYGWTWVVAPWVWGWGPDLYFGSIGPSHYRWWFHRHAFVRPYFHDRFDRLFGHRRFAPRRFGERRLERDGHWIGGGGFVHGGVVRGGPVYRGNVSRGPTVIRGGVGTRGGVMIRGGGAVRGGAVMHGGAHHR